MAGRRNSPGLGLAAAAPAAAAELLAVCVQHEMDHLDGVVFIDHLSMLKKQRACNKLRKLRREEREKEKEKERERR